MSLRRELGRWDLTAVGVNQVIGGAIFALPSVLAASTGGWSPYLVIAVGFASLLIAMTFAEASSRFDATGGAYVYTRAAFGRFPAFEVGWTQWFTRVASWASVLNVLVASLGFYWPSAASGPGRVFVMTVVVSVLTVINIAGIRQSAWTINTLTLGKLVPIALFIAFGLTAIEPARLAAGALPPLGDVSTAALLLIYGFGGYETIPIPAGESRDPRRGVPFALIMTIVIVTGVFTLAQIVALGTLPGLATSKTPLADAAERFMGGGGAAMITIGAVLSTLGNNMGSMLSGSRSLYALAEQHDIPRPFGFVSARFGTPVVAIVITSAITLLLSTTGTFVSLAAASAISRLVLYVATAAATLQFRRQTVAQSVAAPAFALRLGGVVPAAALLVSAALLTAASRQQVLGGVGVLAVGAVLFVIATAGAAARDRSTAR
jgi:basic amino acid/polyamine antiporter, APA family